MDKPVKLGGNKNTQILTAYIALSHWKMDYNGMDWYQYLNGHFTQDLDFALRESCYGITDDLNLTNERIQ